MELPDCHIYMIYSLIKATHINPHLLSQSPPLSRSKDHILNSSCLVGLYQCDSWYCRAWKRTHFVLCSTQFRFMQWFNTHTHTHLQYIVSAVWQYGTYPIMYSHLSLASAVKKAESIALRLSSAACCCASCSSWLASPPCIDNTISFMDTALVYAISVCSHAWQ